MIVNLYTKSTPGLDEIEYKLIATLLPKGISFFLEVFNEIFSTSVYSEKFLMSFIPKEGGENFNQPISLASCLSKILERLICNRLN